MKKPVKIIRTSTIPASIDTFCAGLLRELREADGYDVTVVSSPGKELATIAEREGVSCIAVPMQRHISPLKDLVSLYRLVKAFRKVRPQMVHSITPKAGLLSMMAAWICRVPVRLHTFTGLVFPTATGLKRRLLIFTDRLTCFCATHIVPEGEGVKNDLMRHRITGKPLKVLGHGNLRGIDLDHYSPTHPDVEDAAINLRQQGFFVFCFVGRLVGDKGIRELVAAYTRLCDENPNVKLFLVGRQEPELDPLDQETLYLIENHPGIRAFGAQADVRPFLAAADVFVFPSYREGFPNVVIEAGAMGLPCIVTDINGSREIIHEGENGTIIPPRDADALYHAMHRLYTDRNARLDMAANARNMIASRFEQSYVRHCLKQYYSQILK